MKFIICMNNICEQLRWERYTLIKYKVLSLEPVKPCLDNQLHLYILTHVCIVFETLTSAILSVI